MTTGWCCILVRFCSHCARLLPGRHALGRQTSLTDVAVNEADLPGHIVRGGDAALGAGRRRGPGLWGRRGGAAGGMVAVGGGAAAGGGAGGGAGSGAAHGPRVLEAGVGGTQLGRGPHQVRPPRGVRVAHVRVAQRAAPAQCGQGCNVNTIIINLLLTTRRR